MNQTFDELYNVEPGKHLYQFYKGDDDYFHAMFQYFRAGIENGDYCLWLASETRDMKSVQKLAEENIPNFLSCYSAGQIEILSAESWYLKNGRFDEEQSLVNAQLTIQKALEQGYKQIRAAGDVKGIPVKDWSKLESYEKKVSQVLQGAPVIALCAYPILECSFQDTKMILDCHDDVLIGRL